ncbi:unnamed protein product, partial [Prorocentrum cordatum]
MACCTRPLALLATALAAASAGGSLRAPRTPPRYSVDLSRPPRERWAEPLQDFLEKEGT